MFRKLLSLSVIFCFFLTGLGPIPAAHGSQVPGLPVPGAMVDLSPAYDPVIIKGLTVHKDNPFLFDFIVDVGQDGASGEPLKKEGEKLIKYFLAGLAIPDKDLWVNLSPYEKNSMIPEVLGQTDMGRDLLEQDYILKQITASLIYPEKELGRTFWDKVYAKAQQKYGTTQIPVNTFNKVWIMADKAEIFEHNQTAFVTGCHLKVMLEEDYLALQKHIVSTNAASHSIASNIVRQIVLPELEKEVNTGKNFANLRQIFNSVILSSWYKQNLKQALLNQVYTDKSGVKGIDLKDPSVKERIYEQYLKAYKKGVFDYIKEDISSQGQMIPRKYFSGGTVLNMHPAMITNLAMGGKRMAEDQGHWHGFVNFNTVFRFYKPRRSEAMKGKASVEISNTIAMMQQQLAAGKRVPVGSAVYGQGMAVAENNIPGSQREIVQELILKFGGNSSNAGGYWVAYYRHKPNGGDQDLEMFRKKLAAWLSNPKPENAIVNEAMTNINEGLDAVGQGVWKDEYDDAIRGSLQKQLLKSVKAVEYDKFLAKLETLFFRSKPGFTNLGVVDYVRVNGLGDGTAIKAGIFDAPVEVQQAFMDAVNPELFFKDNYSGFQLQMFNAFAKYTKDNPVFAGFTNTGDVPAHQTPDARPAYWEEKYTNLFKRARDIWQLPVERGVTDNPVFRGFIEGKINLKKAASQLQFGKVKNDGYSQTVLTLLKFSFYYLDDKYLLNDKIENILVQYRSTAWTEDTVIERILKAQVPSFSRFQKVTVLLNEINAFAQDLARQEDQPDNEPKLIISEAGKSVETRAADGTKLSVSVNAEGAIEVKPIEGATPVDTSVLTDAIPAGTKAFQVAAAHNILAVLADGTLRYFWFRNDRMIAASQEKPLDHVTSIDLSADQKTLTIKTAEGESAKDLVAYYFELRSQAAMINETQDVIRSTVNGFLDAEGIPGYRIAHVVIDSHMSEELDNGVLQPGPIAHPKIVAAIITHSLKQNLHVLLSISQQKRLEGQLAEDFKVNGILMPSEPPAFMIHEIMDGLMDGDPTNNAMINRQQAMSNEQKAELWAQTIAAQADWHVVGTEWELAAELGVSVYFLHKLKERFGFITSGEAKPYRDMRQWAEGIKGDKHIPYTRKDLARRFFDKEELPSGAFPILKQNGITTGETLEEVTAWATPHANSTIEFSEEDLMETGLLRRQVRELLENLHITPAKESIRVQTFREWAATLRNSAVDITVEQAAKYFGLTKAKAFELLKEYSIYRETESDKGLRELKEWIEAKKARGETTTDLTIEELVNRHPPLTEYRVKKQLKDDGITPSSRKSEKAMSGGNIRGGIDLNTTHGMQWKDNKDGSGVEMDIDPAMIARFKKDGISILFPIVYQITPITSIWPVVGLKGPG